MIGRVGVVLYVMKRMAERTFLFANAVRNALFRFDFRHRRATGVRRRDFGGRTNGEDDGCASVDGFAWA
jgi:hypothetical protein